MVSTRNQTNPKYSFGKEERFSNLINKNILSYIKKLEEQKLINLDNINNNNLDLQKKLSKCLEIKNLSPFRSNNKVMFMVIVKFKLIFYILLHLQFFTNFLIHQNGAPNQKDKILLEIVDILIMINHLIKRMMKKIKIKNGIHI